MIYPNNTKTSVFRIPDSNKPRAVIIGGGFGGINLIKKLSDKFQVVLLDRYNYHTFQPLLYQVATAGLEPDSVAGPLRKIIQKRDNVYFRMLSVTKVIPEEKTVETISGKLKYDYLVIATGAKINFYNNANMARHAFPLKQVTHALDLRSHIFQQFEKTEISQKGMGEDSQLNFVVVGAGPTGVEVCGALAELRSHVLPKDYPELSIDQVNIFLIEGLQKVLPAMSEESGIKARRYLEKMRVNVILNCRTEEYDGSVVTLNNGQQIKTETLIWAAGVKGNIVDGFNPESIQKGKYLVNDKNQIIKNKNTGEIFQNIFAIGDVSLMIRGEYPKGLPGLAQVAIQQGKHLATNLNNSFNTKTFKPFYYRNKGVLATVGRNKAVADLPGKIKLKGFTGWLIWMVVHLLFLVGFRSKLIALINWIWYYFTYDRGIRLILRPSSKLHDRMSKVMQEEMKETV